MSEPVRWFTDTPEDATQALSTVWTDEKAMQANMGKAHAVAQRIAKVTGVSFEEISERAGNSAFFLRALAEMHDHLKDDAQPAAAAQPAAQPAAAQGAGTGEVQRPEWLLQALVSEAYTNPKHAEHASVTADVNGWYAEAFGAPATETLP